AARNAKQYLRTNRIDYAHWSGREKRDSHRRVRQRRIRKRQTAARCRPGRSTLAIAPDPDDVVRVYFRMFTLVVCQRIWRSRAPRSWFDRHRRNDRRLRHRHLPDPGNVLRYRTTLRRKKTWRRTRQPAERNRIAHTGPTLKCVTIGNLSKPIALYIAAENSGDRRSSHGASTPLRIPPR